MRHIQNPPPPPSRDTVPTPPPVEEWSQVDLEREAQLLSDDIRTCMDSTHPSKRIPVKIPDLKWIDGEVAEAKKAKKDAHNRWRKARTQINYDSYKECVNTYRCAITKARRSSFRTMVDGIYDFASVAKFNKMLNRKNLTKLGQLTDENGQPCATVSASLDILLRSHFPQCSNVPIAEWEPKSNIIQNINDEAVEYITMEKLEEALASFGDYKAAGVDEIKPIVLKNLGQKALYRLVKIFKASIMLAYIPKCWRESRVIFIPKSGKSDYSDPRSFRPLSLMSFILKSLERLVLWRMQETTFLENPFCSNQHAFLKGRSTDSALSNMVEYIEEALIKKQFALAVFLDVKGAFDHVLTKDMIEGLRGKNAPPEIIRWYEYCLTRRKISLEHQGQKVTKYPTRGTPQGGVLSPVMWNVAFESLLSLFPDKGRVKIIGFADDAALVVSGPNHDYLVQLMQAAINKVLEWGKQHGLVFEPTKTVAVTFTHKQVKLPKLKQVTISGHKLKYSTSVKYLGIYLDYRLEWHTHLNNRLNKARILLYKVRAAAGKLWGLNPRMCIWFYRAIVRSMFTYGALVWAKIVASSEARRKLRKLQRLALTAMGHFCRSTPTAGLEVITFTTPLWIHIQQEAAMAFLRTKNLTKLQRKAVMSFNSPKKMGHRHFITNFMMEIGFVDRSSDQCPPRFNWDSKYTVDTTSFEKGQPDREGDVTIYTDGSKNSDGYLGAGFVEYTAQQAEHTHQAHYNLGKYPSVFQSEVYAITKGLDHVLNMLYTNKHIIFYSDSRSALQAIMAKTITSRQISVLTSQLNVLGMHNNIELRWVKAHVGHPGNEKADELAKQGAQDTDHVARDCPYSSAAVIRAELRKKVVAFWQQEWESDHPYRLKRHPCRQTKHFFPKIDKKLSVLFTSCTRKVFSAATQLATGHNFLNRHQFLVHEGTDNEVYPMCRYCDEDEETSQHILAKCPNFQNIRREIFGTHTLDTPFLSKTIKPVQIFEFINKAKIEDLNDDPPLDHDPAQQE